MSRGPAVKTARASKSATSIRQALSAPGLLGNVLKGESWLSWRSLLTAANGEALTDVEREVFHRLTGREREPLSRVEELWVIAGRRGGKSRAAAALAIYEAIFVDHAKVLVVGERPVVLCLAQNQQQATVVFSYIAGIVESTPLLAGLVKTKAADTLSLTNGIDIVVRAASFRGLRGVTAVAVCADEAAFWYTDEAGSANPDTAILDAVRPTLATTSGPLIVISSPYAKKGAVWDTYSRHYGPAGDPRILVAQGASRDFNPSLSQKVVDRAYERDPAAASAEYGGLFRSDLESFISREMIESAIDQGVLVRPPKEGVSYAGFVDASSGTGRDSYTCAIAHAEGQTIVLDLAHEIRPPFNPQTATAEVAKLLKSYGIGTVAGDKYAAGFVIEAFAKNGLTYRYSVDDRSEIYLNALPLLTSGRARLLDSDRMLAQFCALERRTATSGRDRVDHPRDQHDDLANAVAGALVRAAVVKEPLKFVMPFSSSQPRSWPCSDGGGGGIPDFSNRNPFSSGGGFGR
jgi:hypothetical protein